MIDVCAKIIIIVGAVVIHMLGAVAALVCVVFTGKSKRSAKKSDEYVASLGNIVQVCIILQVSSKFGCVRCDDSLVLVVWLLLWCC